MRKCTVQVRYKKVHMYVEGTFEGSLYRWSLAMLALPIFHVFKKQRHRGRKTNDETKLYNTDKHHQHQHETASNNDQQLNQSTHLHTKEYAPWTVFC